jgi:hypothetical protein
MLHPELRQPNHPLGSGAVRPETISYKEFVSGHGFSHVATAKTWTSLSP